MTPVGAQVPNEKDARRDFLTTSVTHNQDAIRGTDTKASVALVLHGIIFSGVVVVTAALGGTFDHAGSLFRVGVIVTLVIAAVCAALSVFALIAVARPSPAATVAITALQSRGAYFPQLKAKFRPQANWKLMHVEVSPPGQNWGDKLNELKTLSGDSINDELSTELLRVAALRTRKTKLASLGFKALAGEVVVIIVYLAILGAHGATRQTLPPVNVSLPSITGHIAVGSRLSVSTGTWKGVGRGAYSYRWQRCRRTCRDIVSATGDVYTLHPQALRALIRAVVTASNDGSKTVAVSPEVGPIAPPRRHHRG